MSTSPRILGIKEINHAHNFTTTIHCPIKSYKTILPRPISLYYLNYFNRLILTKNDIIKWERGSIILPKI